MNVAESDQAIALVNSEVERALEPYMGILSPRDLEAMRAYLTDVALLHPTVSEMVDRLVSRPPMLESGEVSDEAASDPPEKERLGGGKSG